LNYEGATENVESQIVKRGEYATKPDVSEREGYFFMGWYVDKNFSEYFADIYTWMSTTGYIDYIAPQIYFGFEYPEEDFRFSNLLEAWKNAERLENVKLYIGLAAYKIGLQDGDSNEWQTHSDIISRQIDALRKTNADGYMIYSYSGLFSKDVSNKKELKKIKEMNEII